MSAGTPPPHYPVRGGGGRGGANIDPSPSLNDVPSPQTPLPPWMDSNPSLPPCSRGAQCESQPLQLHLPLCAEKRSIQPPSWLLSPRLGQPQPPPPAARERHPPPGQAHHWDSWGSPAPQRHPGEGGLARPPRWGQVWTQLLSAGRGGGSVVPRGPGAESQPERETERVPESRRKNEEQEQKQSKRKINRRQSVPTERGRNEGNTKRKSQAGRRALTEPEATGQGRRPARV